MGRERGQQISPDLFSTNAVRDTSSLPPREPAAEATAEATPQRHVLPKNLHKAVKHLSDEELDLLHAATLEEMKRRGRLPPSVGADSERPSHHSSDLPTKLLLPIDKISKRRPNIVEVSLTRGQVNAVQGGHHASKDCSAVRYLPSECAEDAVNR
jgi:hypothetical protein